jgi:hypothetical protein
MPPSSQEPRPLWESASGLSPPPRLAWLGLNSAAHWDSLQFEHPINQGVVVLRSTFIHEAQTFDALATGDEPGAANLHNTLKVFRANASYMPSTRANFTVGYFNTTGTTDPLLYPSEPIAGSASGSPKSSGGIGEIDFNAWQNTRLGVQYTLYNTFNGASTSYDGAGRNASNNNSLFIFAWLAF